jgi:hypothetical protein
MSIAIDYIFHVGMMAFGGVFALFFINFLAAGTAEEYATPAVATDEVRSEVVVG